MLYDVASGAARDLGLPPGVAVFAGFALGDTALVISQSTPTTRPGISLYSLEDGSMRTLLEPKYGGIDPALIVDCEYVWYPSEDGTPIPALLSRPRGVPPPLPLPQSPWGGGFRAGCSFGTPSPNAPPSRGTRRQRKEGRGGGGLPAVVVVHGGPTGQYCRAFDPYAQFLADRGYVVREPNPRGSTGYGVAFRDAALNDWGGVDLQDFAAGAAYLKALPEEDPERVAVFGGSYGGFMTFLNTVKRPELFKAGAAWVGFSDLPRLYAGSMEHFRY